MKAIPGESSCSKDCAHEQRTITEIGDWIHGHHDSTRTVRQTAAQPDIWDERNCELSHEELRQRITAAAGVPCAHALKATTLLSGIIHLDNGVHRWTVARELGFLTVPVQMAHQPETESWAWPLDG